MNIKQALKKKNQLTSEIKKIDLLIRNYNSIVEGNPRHYSISDLMMEADSKRLELVDLKYKIHMANAPVYKLIFEMSELKNKITNYNCISTTEGLQMTYGKENSYKLVVEYNNKQISDLVKGFEDRIIEIQDELDEFNSITKI